MLVVFVVTTVYGHFVFVGDVVDITGIFEIFGFFVFWACGESGGGGGSIGAAAPIGRRGSTSLSTTVEPELGKKIAPSTIPRLKGSARHGAGRR